MKLSKNAKYGLAGLGALLLIVLGLLIFTASTSKKIGTSQRDETVCEFCGKPLPKSGECLSCSLEMGREVYQAKREGKHWYNSPLIATMVLTVLSILLLTHITLLVRKHSQKNKDVVYYYVRCTKCGRKLRYRDTQFNHMGRCPLCHKPILFPRPPEPEKVNTWRKIVHYVWG